MDKIKTGSVYQSNDEPSNLVLIRAVAKNRVCFVPVESIEATWTIWNENVFRATFSACVK